ncbi:glycosyltransferase family 4 protein [Oligosphaera ethanolica]|uniref:Glycosyltransferase involved in cell wall biosynthesis n=1 Tax=Oligosphaera ethanolica TaxID=760260 RepID=A0AAE3VG72_9BACT|nr:glycosyltransferase family 4 protein [Oligosphaera ethanolica]MDQ0289865.1 glycosyltransferase involved in cell wall biosynthesis [Oligosphaera ethanolica]
MNALIVTCAHVFQDAQGDYYTPSIHSYVFFQRYLAVFEKVTVVARRHPGTIDHTDKLLKVSGPGLTVHEITWYHGLKDLIKKSFLVLRDFRLAAKGADCVIFRVPQMESYLSFLVTKIGRKPYAVEVVGDPMDWTMLSGLWKRLNVKMLLWMTRQADAVAYVSQVLEKRYPAVSAGHVAYYSSVDLPDEVVCEPRHYDGQLSQRPFTLIHITNGIENDSKGHRTFIRAIKICNDLGANVRGIIVGDGSYLSRYQKLAVDLDIMHQIDFTGRIHSREKIFALLSTADMMVLPSETEGLPRVVIEAQATGLPCLSTPVGGVPEILPPSCLFSPEDADGFARRICACIANPSELSELSRQSVATAKKFTKSQLTPVRTAMYRHLCDRASSVLR